MTARYMRYARIKACAYYEYDEEAIDTPVAIAFTEAEVKALAEALWDHESAFFFGPEVTPVLREASRAIAAASDDIQGGER